MDLTYIRLMYSSDILIAVDALPVIFELGVHTKMRGTFCSPGQPHRPPQRVGVNVGLE